MEITVINHRKAPSRIHVHKDKDEITKENLYTTIRLKPGANLLSGKDAEAFEKAKELDIVGHMIDAGTLEVKGFVQGTKTYSKGKHVRDLSELKPMEALAAVADCKDTKTLKRWLHQDGREQVQKAIYARAEVLNPSLITKEETKNV